MFNDKDEYEALISKNRRGHAKMVRSGWQTVMTKVVGGILATK